VTGASGADAAHVDLEAVARASLSPFSSVTPKALGGQEAIGGLRWEQANPEVGQPLRLVSETSGCFFPGGDDPPPPSPAPGERSGSEAIVLTELGFDAPGRPRVGSFRHESLVEEGEDAKLVVRRGYYDRLSLGLRAVDTAEVHLTVLSQSPRVYAYRDGVRLELVMPTARMGSVIARDAEGRSRTFTCDHARVAVSLDAPSGTAMINGSLGSQGRRKNRRPEIENVQVSLSVSRTSHDPGPWVSLAIGVLR
jgi:hypothetical protein